MGGIIIKNVNSQLLGKDLLGNDRNTCSLA